MHTALLELESCINSEDPHEIMPDSSPDYPSNISFSPFQHEQIRIGMDINEDEYPEIEVVEVPVIKRMVFQFKNPVKLEFS